MALTDRERDEIATAKDRNERRLRGLPPLLVDIPEATQWWRPTAYITFSRKNVLDLLVFEWIEIRRSTTRHPRWRLECPWGRTGEYRWVNEHVIVLPDGKLVHCNNPDWSVFARKHDRVPMTREQWRLLVKIVGIKRWGYHWHLDLEWVRGSDRIEALSLPGKDDA